MARVLEKLCLSATVLVLLCAGTANAREPGMVPPDLEYKKLCIPKNIIKKDEFNWAGKTAATSGLPLVRLVDLARLYLYGNAETLPDYKRVEDIISYLLTQGGESREDALQMKFIMNWEGTGVERNLHEAKKIIDLMIANNQPEAYSYLGDIFVEEQNYVEAEKSYKKAYALGRKEASVSLAYLYAEGKIKKEPEEINRYIVNAEDDLISYIASGRCNALTTMGLMYDRLKSISKREEYSAAWFEKAALLNDVSPKLYLAEIIQRGLVLEYDKKRILQLWQEAADLGSSRAMFLLGEDAILNQKSAEDLKTAASWLEKSARRQNIKAIEFLAGLYDGRYPEIADPVKRKYWLEQAVLHTEVKDKTLMQLAAVYEKEGTVPPEKIFSLYMAAAAKGDIDAYVKLGDAYRYGIGTPAQPTRALRYYRRAAGNGETSAMESLKEAYSCRIGAPYNGKKARFWSEQINYYSTAPALNQATAFLIAPSTDENLRAKVEGALKLAAITRDDPESMVLLGVYYDRTGNAAESKKWLERALAADRQSGKDYVGHATLGEIYLDGKLQKQNEEEGLRLLEEAAKAGNSGAYNALGRWYGKKGDAAQAEKYFVLAAENGKISAYKNLAEVMIGRGETARAIAVLEKAALRHDIEIMLKLAEGYDVKGWIGRPDPQKARYWFDRALQSYPCRPGDLLAIAGAYLEGKFGVSKDEREARKWLELMAGAEPEDDQDRLTIAQAILGSSLVAEERYRTYALKMLEKASASGDSEAVRLLGDLYMRQDFPGYDVKKAVIWLTKSAEAGNASAMMALASMYMSGYGVPPSPAQAKAWLEKAAAGGNEEAARRLEKMKPAGQ